MISEEFKTELTTFLSYKDVEFIINDINNLLQKFNPKNNKMYLPLLANIFLRYRTQIADVEVLSGQNYIEVKNVTIKQDKTKIETIEVKNVTQYFTEIDLNFFSQYFSSISYATAEDYPSIEFSRNSIEQNLSHEINQKDESMFLPDGLFYTYFKIQHQQAKNNYNLPINISNENIKQSIEKVLRFYAWARATYEWSDFITDIRDINSVPDNYQALQWYFDGYYKRSTPFNAHSPKRYASYLAVIKSNEKSKFNSRISKVNLFTESLVVSVKSVFTLLNNPPFSVQRESKSNLYKVFQNFMSTQQKLSSSPVLSFEDIVDNYHSIKEFFDELGLTRSEFYDLNTENVMQNLIHTLVNQVIHRELPVEFPFNLIWETTEPQKAKDFMKAFNETYSDADLKLVEFLLEYVSDGISHHNFASYFKKLNEITDLEKQLLKSRDLSDLDVHKFAKIKKVTAKSGTYDVTDFKDLYEVEKNIRHYLNVFKTRWVHDICGDPIFANDPLFKRFFPLNLGMDKEEYIHDLENYLQKWADYRDSSEKIKALREQIKVISMLKFKFEGKELVSDDYPGAMSLIKAQKLVLREKTRLILKLKELVSLVSRFQFSAEFKHKVDSKVSMGSEDKLLFTSVELLDTIELFRKELLEKSPITDKISAFSESLKSLIGKDTKVTQLETVNKTLRTRFDKFSKDNVIYNYGMHFTNINDSFSKIFSLIGQLMDPVKKYYAEYIAGDVLKAVEGLASEKTISNLDTVISNIATIFDTASKELHAQFADIHTYFDVLCDVTSQLMKFSRLASRKDFYGRLDKVQIEFFEEDNTIVIEDRIDKDATLLKKQKFLDKTFSLFIALQRACSQVEFSLSKSFNHLIQVNPFKKAPAFSRDQSLGTKIKIVMDNVDNMYAFIKSIKFPSKRMLNDLRSLLKRFGDFKGKGKGITPQLESELFATRKLINGVIRNRNNLGLMRKLNNSLTGIDKKINVLASSYLTEKLGDEPELVNQLLTAFKQGKAKKSFAQQLNDKITKLEKLFNLSDTELKDNAFTIITGKARPKPKPKPVAEVKATPEPELEQESAQEPVAEVKATPEPTPEPELEQELVPEPELEQESAQEPVAEVEAKPESTLEPKLEQEPAQEPKTEVKATPEPTPEPELEQELVPEPESTLEPELEQEPAQEPVAEAEATPESTPEPELVQELVQEPVAEAEATPEPTPEPELVQELVQEPELVTEVESEIELTSDQEVDEVLEEIIQEVAEAEAKDEKLEIKNESIVEKPVPSQIEEEIESDSGITGETEDINLSIQESATDEVEVFDDSPLSEVIPDPTSLDLSGSDTEEEDLTSEKEDLKETSYEESISNKQVESDDKEGSAFIDEMESLLNIKKDEKDEKDSD